MADYNTNVFINCPYDEDYKGLMMAVIFTVIIFGYNPRLACERSDGGENRIDKIVSMIEESKNSIHDLSRLKSTEADEYFRLNMPLELGMDFACKKIIGGIHTEKRLLVLEEEKYRFREAISDLSGIDIKDHDGRSDKVIRCVRDWFAETLGLRNLPSADIINSDFTDSFQVYFLEEAMKLGYSETNYYIEITIPEYITFINSWLQDKETYIRIAHSE